MSDDPDEPGVDHTELRQALAPRAFLHADPDSYLAGVEDALDGVAGTLAGVLGDDAPGAAGDTDTAAD